MKKILDLFFGSKFKKLYWKKIFPRIRDIAKKEHGKIGFQTIIQKGGKFEYAITVLCKENKDIGRYIHIYHTDGYIAGRKEPLILDGVEMVQLNGKYATSKTISIHYVSYKNYVIEGYFNVGGYCQGADSHVMFGITPKYYPESEWEKTIE